MSDDRALLVLASQSPRRIELMRLIGLQPRVEPADVDESWLPGEDPRVYVERVAHLKAATVARRLLSHSVAGPDGGRAPIVVAADTTVDLDGEVFAKPVDDDHAAAMLRRLSGRTHQVHTAVVCRAADTVLARIVSTAVTLTVIDETRIAWYLGFGEHTDKAGAYAIQGAAGVFVERVEGSPSGVIGLPLAETVALLGRCGVDGLATG